MKNKKVTYGLILMVLIIWGTIFYKVFTRISGQKTASHSVSQVVVRNQSDAHEERLALLLNYPDPFLKGRGTEPSTAIPGMEPVDQAPQVVNWPLVEYHGSLYNKIKKEETGLLRIEGSDFLVKKGAVFAGIKIRTIAKDSIFLDFQNNTRWIPITR